MTVPETPSPDKSPDKISSTKALESDVALKQPGAGSSFESHMQQGVAPEGATKAGQAPSPMSAVNQANIQTGKPTLDTLMGQAKTAQDSLGTVQKQLQTPNLTLKRSQAHLLKNKLTNVQTYSREAAAKIGVEKPPMASLPPGTSIIERFLHYIGDGQDQFASIQTQLDKMSQAGHQIDPAAMLQVQAKMNLAQQEVEYSSTMLTKVVSAITTVLGIQL